MGLDVANNKSVIGCCISNSFCGRDSVCGGTKGVCKCSSSVGCGGFGFHTGVSLGLAGDAILGIGLTGVCRGSFNPKFNSGSGSV